MSKSNRLKSYLIFTIFCISLICILLIIKEIKKYKNIDYIKNNIENSSTLKTVKLSKVMAVDLPLKLGANEKKNVFFSAKFKFKGGDRSNYQNIFQTSPFNYGIRIEINRNTLAVIYSDKQNINGYSVQIIENKLIDNEENHIEIEALYREFISIKVNGQEVMINSPNLEFATNEFLIGGGFNSDRTYSGEIRDIEFKSDSYNNWVNRVLTHLPTDIDSILRSITNIGLLLAVLIYFVLSKLNKMKISLELIYVGKNIQLFLLALIQILLIYFLPPYKYILIHYAFLYMVGILFVKIIIPNTINVNGFNWLFAPLIGLMMSAICGAYVIAYDLPIRLFVILPILPFCLILVLKYCLRERLFIHKTYISFENILACLKCLGFLSPIIILSLWTSFDGINFTTPIRVGPDAALYAYMNQYLLDGGTWSEAANRLQEFQGMNVGDITKNTNFTMDWPFLYYYRWGLSSFQIMASLINGHEHAYEFGFSSLIIPYLLLGGIVFYWLKEFFKLNIYMSFLGFIGFIFNVNLLNLWFEGFYGNIFSICLYGLLYLLIDSLSYKDELTIKQKIQNSVFLGVVFSAILASYGEGLLFVLPALLAIHFALNLFFRRSIDINLYSQLLGGLVIAIIVMAPCKFLLDWIYISLKQVTEEGGNGYPQPYWAYLSEILGFSNIYRKINASNGGVSMIYSNKQLFITILSSIVLITIVCFKFGRNISNCIFGMSAYIFTFILLFYIYKTNPANNYAYMKTYIFLMPVLFVYFWSAVAYLGRSILILNEMRLNIIAISLAGTMVLNGISYIVTYEATAKKINIKYTLEHRSLSNLNLENVVLYPVVGSIYHFLLPAIINATWLTTGWDNQEIKNGDYLSNFLNRKIYLFIEKDDCRVYQIKNSNIIYNGKYFLIVDSEILIKNLVNSGMVDMSQIKEFEVLKQIIPKQCYTK